MIIRNGSSRSNIRLSVRASCSTERWWGSVWPFRFKEMLLMWKIYSQNRVVNRKGKYHLYIHDKFWQNAYVLLVCYAPKHSRPTKIYSKQEGNSTASSENFTCLPQGFNECPQQQWLAYLVKIFKRSGKDSDNRERKLKSTPFHHYESSNKPDSKQINQLNQMRLP